MDAGQIESERLLKQIERDVIGFYGEAKKDIEHKFNEFNRKTKIKEEIKRKQLKAGEITQDEFNNWLSGQIIAGERWKEQLEVLSSDLTNAHNIAQSMVNGYMPEMYAIGHNYGTYQIEKIAKMSTSYTLYDRQTVERLIRENPEILPKLKPLSKTAKDIRDGKIKKWEKRQIQSTCLQGILQGESIPEIAERISKITMQDAKSTIRYARTMTTGAENAGRINSYKRAENMGIEIEQQWLATLDNRTREEHREMDGEHVKIGEKFSNGCEYPGDPNGDPATVWNCFIGETEVASDCEIIRSYKHKYKGELIRIVSASGVNFTCTPNHPILTPNGWVAAARLNNGDNLLIARIRNDRISAGDIDIYHVHSSMKTLHDSFRIFGRSDNIPMTNFNFHGDIPTSDVEVVSKEGLLRVNGDSRFRNGRNKFVLKNPNTFISGKRHFMSRFGRIYISSFSFMSRSRQSLPFIRRSLRHTDVHGFRTVARDNSSISKNPINNISTATVIGSKFLNGFSGEIFVDNIISINKSSGCTHVYNLQTENGYYFVNTSIPQNQEKGNGNFAIAHNCRCTLIPLLIGIDNEDVTDLSERESSKLDGMSYSEWKKAKPKYEPIEKQKKTSEAIKRKFINQYKETATRLKDVKL